MRTYITPVKLNRFSSDNSDLCYKCNQDKGSWFHCVWDCGKIQDFWREVSHMVFKMLSVQLPLHPKIFILGSYPPSPHINNKVKPLIDMCLLQAKRMIALNWKNTTRPSIGQWLREMSSALIMERITYMTKGKSETFNEIWEPFMKYIEQNEVGGILATEANRE